MLAGFLLAGAAVGGVRAGNSLPSSLAKIGHGSASLKHTESGDEVRWRLRSTTVYLDASLDQLGSDTRDAVKDAFATWTSADPNLPSVRFEAIQGSTLQTKPDGKNTVLFAPITVKGHEHDLAITLTYSDEETGNIVEADVVVNTEYPFRNLTSTDDGYEPRESDDDDSDSQGDDASMQPTVSASRASCTVQAQRASCDDNAYDVQNVLTHEVGHFYGLGEDMQDAAATMYYCTSRCETHKRVLTASDATVMAALYSAPGNAGDDTGAGCGGARMAPRGGLAEAGMTLVAALAVLARRRRR